MKTLCFSPLLALLLGCHLYFCGSAFASYSNSGSLQAMCRMHPNTRTASGMPCVYGQIIFKQSGSKEKLNVTFRLHGLPVDSKQPRAMHIHEYGDLSKGCNSTGGHYNPLRINHPGDFGNFVLKNGKICQSRHFNATLFGKLPIIGRSVVIHEGNDDLGRGGNAESLLNGNAGRRLTCCVIGLGNPRN
ncbi:extracellular superoxide dismutase [Cu-Zn] [Triplophysa rosa]|uniref:Extracellular superoxide dismutase n=1 Tax=Triplophysa rosa TaxID=992332 RepID=A0A9W7WYC7_TRIRA|nr:extracellular superoxide dismutase [Cu-Zn] [Triplophysa rosa]KAI7810591.1 putative extracellular superoxide dismutase [Triplophysa rosa]